MNLKNFNQAQEFLYSYIPKTVSYTYSADWGLSRTKYLLELVGNPQNKVRVIHIAGTSGKGSTAYLTSLLLKSLGQKTGLALSPHLIDIRERFQINSQLISRQKFVSYLSQIISAIKRCEESQFGKPTYFELVTILAFYIFYQEKVDFAVIETGLGGLYDATNSIDNPEKTAVITKIGLDHTSILGKTITEIAFQKAGIIHKKNRVFSIEQERDAKKIIEKVCEQKNSTLSWIEKDTNFSNIKVSSQKTTFSLAFNLEGCIVNLENLELGMLGEYQAQNASLSLVVIYYLSQKYNFEFNEQKVRNALRKAKFLGRFEVIHKSGKLIIVDGAHNPQKMASFLDSVAKIFPGRKFNFLVAFKNDKDYTKILELIKPFARKIFITTFFIDNMDLIRFSQDPQELVKSLRKLGVREFEVISNNQLALEKSLREDNGLIVVGSLYLLADIYPSLW